MKERRFGRAHYPSLAEVQADERWPTFEALLHAYSPDETRKGIADAIDSEAKRLGLGAPLEGTSQRDFIRLMYFAQWARYEKTDDPLTAFDNFRKFIDELEGVIISDYQAKHLLQAELKRAGASWPMIAAMVIPEWETKAQFERRSATDELKARHENYKKTNRKRARKYNKPRP